MKAKLLLAAILVCGILSSYAQKNIPKGSLLIGGNFSFASNNFKNENNVETKSNAFTISPSCGIAVKDNLMIGLNFGYSFYKNSYYSNYPYYDSSRVHSFNYGIFARKYKPLKNNFYLFLQGNLGGFNSKRDLENTTTRDYYEKQVGVNMSVTPGISYAINSKLQIETGFSDIFGIGYSKIENKDNLAYTGVRKESRFNAFTTLNNFSSQIYFGFRLLIQKKDKRVISAKEG
jgi:hypothetical protein